MHRRLSGAGWLFGAPKACSDDGRAGRGGVKNPACEDAAAAVFHRHQVGRSAQGAGRYKYVIVNADEGDPRFHGPRRPEGNPHSILEGLIIGAYAMGSHEGYIYVRQEYPLALENVGVAIKQAREYGFLGRNILGSNFDFDIKVHRGAGAFVCGEETALLLSLEGKPGEPRPRPPYPATSGLWGKPTNINNVDTWANVPLIVNNGADWFNQFGTAKSKGT